MIAAGSRLRHHPRTRRDAPQRHSLLRRHSRQLCLERLDTDGRRLNAVVTLTPEIALREAALADAERQGGLDRGPLHGIPYGMKDIVAAAGAPTTWGAAPFRDQASAQEATVTRKLRDAGAVLVAKLATVEIAGGMSYKNPNAAFTGPTANPWDEGRWTSGSSSGPGAAVAAGAVPFAIGSDTSGSILYPAAFTGISGLRATYGRVSRAWRHDPVLDARSPRPDVPHGGRLRPGAGSHRRPRPRRSCEPARALSLRATAPGARSGFRFGVIDGACDGISPEVAANFATSLDLLQQHRNARNRGTAGFPLWRAHQHDRRGRGLCRLRRFHCRRRLVRSDIAAFRRRIASPPRFCPRMTISAPNASATV